MERRSRGIDWRSDAGYGVSSLLIVAGIAALIVLVAIPFYHRQKARDSDAVARLDARNAAVLIKDCYTRTRSPALCTTKRGLQTATDVRITDNAPRRGQTRISSFAGGGFQVASRSESGNLFTLTENAQGRRTYTCRVADKGVRGNCREDGTWGLPQ